MLSKKLHLVILPYAHILCISSRVQYNLVISHVTHLFLKKVQYKDTAFLGVWKSYSLIALVDIVTIKRNFKCIAVCVFV